MCILASWIFSLFKCILQVQRHAESASVVQYWLYYGNSCACASGLWMAGASSRMFSVHAHKFRQTTRVYLERNKLIILIDGKSGFATYWRTIHFWHVRNFRSSSHPGGDAAPDKLISTHTHAQFRVTVPVASHPPRRTRRFVYTSIF